MTRRTRGARLTVGGGLAWVCLLFALPLTALSGLVVAGSAGDLLGALKEERGAAYLAQIWPALSDPGRDLGADQPAHDLEFGTAEAADDFIRASAIDTRLHAGAQLIGDVADVSGLSREPDLTAARLAEAASQRLPALLDAAIELSEAAQIRDADQAQRLAVAVDRLQAAADQAQAALEAAGRYDASGVAHSVLAPHIVSLAAAARDLAARGQAAAAGGDPNAVTGAREALQRQADEAWRAAQGELYRQIDARILSLSERLAGELALVLALAIAAGWVAARVGRNLTGRIDDLAQAGEQLGADRLTVAVPHTEAPGAIGRLARAMDEVKGALIERNRRRFDAEDRFQAVEARLDQAQAALGHAQAERRAAVEHLGAAIRRLGEGDLTAEAAEPLAGEFEGLRGDFNTAVVAMRETLMAASGEAEGLRREVERLARGGEMLARRGGEQREGLDEAARSLSELSDNAREALAEARRAHEAVGAAKDEAVQGDAVVRQAAEAMGQINQLAGQITQIIGVMDEIAFQTNLLALNAGVEAARSGEAGRGFAVVAQEVRALAQRAASAAKDIRGLIQASTSQVGVGVELVGQTSHALGRVLTQVGRIEQAMGAVSAQAATQASGLGEVDAALRRLDQAAGQGAEALDDSAAAARQLQEQVEALASWIAALRLVPPEPVGRRPLRPGALEPLASPSRLSEPRHSEPRQAESRHAESRLSEPRTPRPAASVIQLREARSGPGGLRPFPDLRPNRRFDRRED